jgi:hypothetical protein
VQNGAYSAQFTQSTSGGIFIFGPRKESLDLTLAQGAPGPGAELPWDLRLDTGASSSTIDLTGVVLRSLNINSGAASVDVTVGPTIVDNATVVIKGGAGSYDLKLPDSLDIRVQAKTGLSSNTFADGFAKQGDTYVHDGGGKSLAVTIEAGVSSVDVSLY